MTATTTAPAPGSAEWARLVTASKAAAIYGASPWQSPRSTWHTLRGELPATPETTTTSRGHFLEPSIVAWWRAQHPEYTRFTTDVFVPHEHWAGVTLDGLAREHDGEDAETVIVEAKSTVKREEWGDPGTDEVPLHYAFQAMFQLAVVREARRVYIPVLFGPRLEFAEYVIERDDDTADVMLAHCHEFWQSTRDDDAAPPVDDTVATFTTLKRLHTDIDQDATVELDEPTAREFIEATTGLKTAEARDRKARSTVLDLMGNARHAKHNGVVIARRQPGRHGISLVPVAKTLPERNDQ